MKIELTEIIVAFGIISMGRLHENSAYLHSENGNIYYFLSGEPDEEIIEEFNDVDNFLENPFVIEIPNQQELKLTKRSSQSDIKKALKNWCAEQNIKTKV